MQNASPKILFDTGKLSQREARARTIAKADAGFLANIAAETIADRLRVISREFPRCIDILSRTSDMEDQLSELDNVGTVERIGGFRSGSDHVSAWNPDAANLPIEPESIDLITSIFGLHRTNNLPDVLFQLRHALKPDGLLMAAVPGDQTLKELRDCFMIAETEITGGASMRVDPFGEVRQFGDLLQRAGFALPVVDSEVVTIRYDGILSLVKDLRAMGASQIFNGDGQPLTKGVLARAEELYHERYGDEDGRIRATMEFVYILGWAPHESQQKPLKPGSAKSSLAKALSPKN